MQLEIITQEPVTNAHSTPLLFIHGMWHAAQMLAPIDKT